MVDWRFDMKLLGVDGRMERKFPYPWQASLELNLPLQSMRESLGMDTINNPSEFSGQISSEQME